jgi:competence protein ComEC
MSPAAPHHDAPHRGPPSRAAPARYHPLVIVLAAAATGILLDRYGRLPLGAWWGMAGAAMAAWLVLWRRRRAGLSAVALLLAAGATAASWHHCRWHLTDADDLAQFVKSSTQPICIEAIALETPRPLLRAAFTPFRVAERGNQVRCELALVGIRDGTAWRRAAGRSRIVVQGLLPEVERGDRLRIFAQLSALPQMHNPGQFDTAGYLRAARIRSQLRAEFAESVSRLSPGTNWSLWRWLERIRLRGSRLLDAHLEPGHVALADAVLLGVREQIEPEETEAFMKTGTIHLLM